MAARVACVVGVVGSPLTGKGLFAHDWLTRSPGARHRLVWSPVEATDNYAGLLGCRPLSSIPALVDQLKAGSRAAVFFPSPERDDMLRQFDHFCRVAWAVPGARVLVEELSRVTSASWSPPAWRNICTAGSHRGLEVMGTIQRAARADKDFFDACTELRVYRLNRSDDAMSMAAELPGDRAQLAAEIQGLPDRHYLHFRRGGPVERGVQAIPGEKKTAGRRRKAP